MQICHNKKVVDWIFTFFAFMREKTMLGYTEGEESKIKKRTKEQKHES